MLAESAFSSSRNLSSACLNYYTMPLRFLYRTADISALSRRLDSAEIYTRYNNVYGIVHINVNLVLFYSVSGNGDFYGKSKKIFLLYCPPHILHPYWYRTTSGIQNTQKDTNILTGVDPPPPILRNFVEKEKKNSTCNLISTHNRIKMWISSLKRKAAI